MSSGGVKPMCKEILHFCKIPIDCTVFTLLNPGLADFLVGAICYVHRGLQTSKAKLAIIEKITERSGYNLLQNTLYKVVIKLARLNILRKQKLGNTKKSLDLWFL